MTNNPGQSENNAVTNRLLSGIIEFPESELAIDTGRVEKVANLKRLIQAGNYQPDLEKVAESLLNYIMAVKC